MISAGKIIRTCRNAKGLSKTDLSRLTGVPVASIYHYEQGVYEPKYSTFIALITALGYELAIRPKE